eukprot:TRINITY_DN38441_c0_g3_i1.p1 TRINITY_DN38441_c0_g3~~TRINITY_DN38441_c0_g3_i1.p1  ORF type:complete len:127 (+),score=4.68 TRINITY_DN38441_c0_g3_i1:88-468(+)
MATAAAVVAGRSEFILSPWHRIFCVLCLFSRNTLKSLIPHFFARWFTMWNQSGSGFIAADGMIMTMLWVRAPMVSAEGVRRNLATLSIRRKGACFEFGVETSACHLIHVAKQDQSPDARFSIRECV